MIITCSNCGTKFNLNEKLLKPAGSKVQCSKCSHVFLAYPSAAPVSKPVPPPEPPPRPPVRAAAKVEKVDVAVPAPVQEEKLVGDDLDLPDLEKMLGTDTEPAPPEEKEAEDKDLDLGMDDLPTDKLPEDDLSLAPGDLDEPDLESMLGTDTEPMPPEDQDADDLGLDLDLDSEPAGVKAVEASSSDGEELELPELESMLDVNLESKSVAPEAPATTDDLDLSDLEDFLDGDKNSDKKTGSHSDEEVDIDLDMDLDLEPEEVEGSDEELDIDLDLEPEGDSGEGELNLDLESEDGKEADLDLDLDLDAGGETPAEEGLDLDIKDDDSSAEDLDADDFDFEIEEETEEPDEEREEEIDLADLERTLEMDLLEPDSNAPQAEPEDVELEFDFENESDEELTEKEGVDLTGIEDILDMDEKAAPGSYIADDGTEDLELEFDIEGDETAEAAPKAKSSEKRELNLDFDTPEESKTGKGREATVPLQRQKNREEEELAETRILKVPAAQKETAEKEDLAKQKQVVIKKSKMPMLLVIILVSLLVIAGAAVGVHFAGFEVPVVSDLIDGAMGKSKAPADPQGILNLEAVDFDARYVNNGILGNLFVISGRVRNNYAHPRSQIQVKAQLLDGQEKVVATSPVYYCGNVLTDSEIESIDLEGIEQRLSIQIGKDGVNVNVAPNSSVPFMIIFANYPDSMEGYKVIPAGSIKGQ